MALIKLIFMAGSLFGMGSLPWQQNFIGLLAGISFGTLLTVALVPFVSITKYGRQKKINLIWTCLIFHLVVYIAMFIIFYLFPMAFVSLGLGGEGFGLNNGYANGGYSVGGNPVSCAKGACTGIDAGVARINA
ncbi:Inactive rhomboid protein 1 [Pseudolycoriella hygida]|uniref:Inactive rhomboid protein 1 n=1 Tax=Pseudolycoriella hygida TaxID=35572 RepID=A0A9Q0N6B0_9DIPT|nr:Inactive rhomboid protein 1 [Pseudolycoriella hygida]